MKSSAQRRADLGGVIATVGANVAALSDTGMTAAATYSHRVRAFNGEGYSDYSNVATVTTMSGPATMHVSNIETGYQQLNRKRFKAQAGVTIVDGQGNSVEGAKVLGTWTLPNGKTRSQQPVPDGAGISYFGLDAWLGRTLVFCVDDVTKTGYLYDPGDNTETCDSVSIA